MIKANNIQKSYGDLRVLKGVNLEIKKGEFISIVGASGAGKTTLLQILGTLDEADQGELNINKQVVNKLNDKSLSSFRNQSIGFVFQFHNLLAEFTALENICLPAFIAGTPITEAEKRAKELLELLNIIDRANHKPNELSGGEQQRVAVARALINNPAVVLADEPSGNLDSQNADELHQLFFQLNKELGQTFILVTHNQKLADMADRKLVMKDGVIVD
ncbi:MAG: lipoprotein-releasing system ATP-binding protein LolD [Flavobacteriales bacterium]|nr:lipoprotein-releasing system ATP-binding protein LolD [Flavobacteriales bacterium]